MSTVLLNPETSTTIATAPRLPAFSYQGVAVPALIADAGDQARDRFLEFFAATIRNSNTRSAYARAVSDFFLWCEARGITSLSSIAPLLVATYFEHLTKARSAPTVKQHLAAIRMLFNWLVINQVVSSNPASAVRGPKHVVRTGKTPVLTIEEARALLTGIPVAREVGRSAAGDPLLQPEIRGLRDRALIAVMIYSFARVGAVTSMKVKDYYTQGRRAWFRFHEKGGRRHEVPAHHKAEQYVDAYIAEAGIEEDDDGPLFRSVYGLSGKLTHRPMSRSDAYRVIRLRAAEAKLETKISCHSCRATGITAYLMGGGSLEHAQQIAAHESPRTTKLYDRTSNTIALAEIEKIDI